MRGLLVFALLAFAPTVSVAVMAPFDPRPGWAYPPGD